MFKFLKESAIKFWQDCKAYYHRNDDAVSDLGRGLGAIVGGFAGTLLGATIGNVLDFFDVDSNKDSYLITYIASSVGFLGGAILFRYSTVIPSGIFGVFEAIYDRLLLGLDYLLDFRYFYDKINNFVEGNKSPSLHDNLESDNKPTPKKCCNSNELIMRMTSAGVGAGVGHLLFSKVGKFVAPNLVIATVGTQSITPESIGQEWGHVLGAMMGLIVVMPLYKAGNFSVSFTCSVMYTIFCKPVLCLKKKCHSHESKEDNQSKLLNGPINETKEEGNYVPPPLQDVVKKDPPKTDPPKSVDELTSNIRELRRQRRQLGYKSSHGKRSKEQSIPDAKTTETPQASQVQVRLA